MGGKRAELDPKIIHLNHLHYSNYVKYYLYYDKNDRTDTKIYVPEDPKEEFEVSWNSGCCFSDLMGELRNSCKKDKNPINRIYYEMTIDKTANVKVTDEERIAWIKMIKKNRLLPTYINSTQVAKTGVLVLDLTSCTPSKLYLHLSMVRYIREEPGFVKAMVHLVKEVKMNFFVAFVYASKTCIAASGHHVLSLGRAYGLKEGIKSLKTPIVYMRGLYHFINDHKKYDTRKLGAKVESGNCHYDGTYSFSCSRKMEKDASVLLKGEYTYKFKDLFKKGLITAIKAETAEEAKKHLEDMKKPKIKKVKK